MTLNHPLKAVVGFLVSYDSSHLTIRQLNALLRCSDAPQTVRRLAADMGVTKPVITRSADKLEELGWIRRCEDKEDRRSIILKITPAGMRLVEGLKDALNV